MNISLVKQMRDKGMDKRNCYSRIKRNSPGCRDAHQSPHHNTSTPNNPPSYHIPSSSHPPSNCCVLN